MLLILYVDTYLAANHVSAYVTHKYVRVECIYMYMYMYM
jgi:hypothetical protein